MLAQDHDRKAGRPLLMVICLAVASASAESRDGKLPNFQKVNAQPTDDGFRELARLGIKIVIDLHQIGKHSQANEQKLVTSLGMRCVSISRAGMSMPKDDQVTATLALLSDTTSEPVFVHCKRGADRTAMVVAVYRVSRDGWDNKKAVNEAKSYRMTFFERAIQHYVMDYKPRVVLATAGAAPGSSVPQTLGASQ